MCVCVCVCEREREGRGCGGGISPSRMCVVALLLMPSWKALKAPAPMAALVRRLLGEAKMSWRGKEERGRGLGWKVGRLVGSWLHGVAWREAGLLLHVTPGRFDAHSAHTFTARNVGGMAVSCPQNDTLQSFIETKPSSAKQKQIRVTASTPYPLPWGSPGPQTHPAAGSAARRP
jgi:hypothetical protein